MTDSQYFGSLEYPGSYWGVFGELTINIETGEVVDGLDREAIDNHARLHSLPGEETPAKRNIYMYIQDEIFGIDEDTCVGRGIGHTETGVALDINHWMEPNQDATITIDDTGTHVRVHGREGGENA